MANKQTINGFREEEIVTLRHWDKKQGEWVTAFAAMNYAHAWLDAAAIAGWLDVKHKDRNRYFTID